MDESIEAVERRVEELRAAVRRAALAGDRAEANRLRAELRQAEEAWETRLADLTPPVPDRPGPATASLVPMREQVHHVLTLLTVPTAPKLIAEVHRAFFDGDLQSARLTSLRRDEERSFTAAPYSRPYYICPALTATFLNAARGQLTVSTWSIADRVVGPLSPRVHFLTAAIKVAEAIDRLDQPRPEASRLLWRFAANIPGVGAQTATGVAAAARAELVVHSDSDTATRTAAARRAQKLDDTQRLFGSTLGPAGARRGEAG